jgi:hypothetical protein
MNTATIGKSNNAAQDDDQHNAALRRRNKKKNTRKKLNLCKKLILLRSGKKLIDIRS